MNYLTPIFDRDQYNRLHYHNHIWIPYALTSVNLMKIAIDVVTPSTVQYFPSFCTNSGITRLEPLSLRTASLGK